MHAINGIPGKMTGLSIHDSGRIMAQTWDSDPITWEEGGRRHSMRVHVRFDDECKNGHETFAVTADIWIGGRWAAGGCCHRDIEERAPALAPLLKWHLVSTDGPMHYLANTCYHASDKDHRGLRKGETRQLRNGRTGLPVWRLAVVAPSGKEVKTGTRSWTDSETKPPKAGAAKWLPVLIEGEGKERDLDAARSCAVWPDAPDEILTGPREDLELVLVERLPALLEEFRRAMVETCGFRWPDAAS